MTDGPRRHAASARRRRKEFEFFHVRLLRCNKLRSCCADIVSSSEREREYLPGFAEKGFSELGRKQNETNFRQFGLEGLSVA
jgi:hypothetical protein